MRLLTARYRRLGIAAAVLAFSLRLAVPVWAPAPSVAAPSAADLVALFGEHALCIAAARGEAPSDPGSKPKAEHDHGVCCLFHGNLGFTLPPAPTVPTRIALYRRIDRLVSDPALVPRHPHSTAQARAPPPQA